MDEIVQIVKSDGTVRTENVVFLDPDPVQPVPTTEDRLSALESAMLSMMGVTPSV